MTNSSLSPKGGRRGSSWIRCIMLGAVVNYAILAPWLIQRGDIEPNAAGQITFRQITFWSLWFGVAMMTMASLFVFFSKPQILISAFTKFFRRREESSDILGH